MKKRILSFLLVLAMVVSFLPAYTLTASAEATDPKATLAFKPVAMHSDANNQVVVDIYLTAEQEFTMGSMQFYTAPQGVTAALTPAADFTVSNQADGKIYVDYLYGEVEGMTPVTVGTTPLKVGTLTLTGDKAFSVTKELLNVTDPQVARSPSDGAYIPAITVGYDKGGHGVGTWTPLSGEIKPSELASGSYYLSDNATVVTANAAMAGTKEEPLDITICLNGHDLTGDGAGRMFRLQYVNFTVCDCTAHEDAETGYTAGEISNGGYNGIKGSIFGLFNGPSTLTIEDGILNGDGQEANNGLKDPQHGGAINSYSASVININGGVIRDFAAVSGGAICMAQGTLNLNGGTITDCEATNGGAVAVLGSATGAVNVNGTDITNCTATHGGAIYLKSDKATGSITDGTGITGNTAAENGGAVCVDGAKLTITDTTLKGNTARYGGAVYTVTAGSKTTITGSTIGGAAVDTHYKKDDPETPEDETKELAAEGIGGGVYAGTNAVYEISDTTFSDCTTQIGGAAVYGQSGATIRLTDVTVTNLTLPETDRFAVYIGGTSTKLIVSGATKIIGNKCGSTPTDVYFNNDYNNNSAILFVDELTEGASIQVRSKTKQADPDNVLKVAEGGSQSSWNVDWVRDHYSPNLKINMLEDNTFEFVGHIHDGVNDENGESIVWTPWGDDASELTSLPKNTGYYYLTADITVSATQSTAESSNVHLCLNNHTIQKGATEGNYRAFAVGISGTLDIHDCQANGVASELQDSYTAGKITGFTYGAISTGANAVINFHDGIIDNCTNGTDSGGAIILWSSGKLVMDGGAITNCEATNTASGKGYGGAIQTASSDTAMLISISNAYFAGNSAYRNGGVINATPGIMSITNTVFTKNEVGTNGYGAAIFANGNSQITLDGCTVTGNTANGSGGSAIQGNNATSVTLKDTTVTGNTNGAASGYVGAVYLVSNAQRLTLEGKVIIDNNTSSSGNEYNIMFQNTYNSANGAGIQVKSLADGSRVSYRFRVHSSVTPASTAAQMVALASGGTAPTDTHAIACDDVGKNVVWDSTNSEFIFLEGHDHTGYVDGTDGTQTWEPWNTATTLPASGHYYLTTDVSISTRVNVTDLNLCLNGHIITGSAQLFNLTGTDSKLNIVDCGYTHVGDSLISGSISGAEKGIVMYQKTNLNATATFRDVLICDNDLTAAGGLFTMQNQTTTSQSTLNLYGCEVRDNTTTDNAGIVYAAYDNIVVYAKDTRFLDNYASKRGSVYWGKGTLTLENCVVDGNSAGTEGGAIYLSNTNVVNITDTQITNNTAGTSGGAINMAGAANVTITNSTVSGNEANGGKGGAIVTSANGGTVKITGSHVDDNTTSSEGGAIYGTSLTSGKTLNVTVTDSTLNGNTSASHGSALRLMKGSGTLTVNITDTQINNNTATDSDAISAVFVSGGTYNLTGVTMQGNEAAKAAAMRIESVGRVTLDSCTITGNSAGSDGAVLLNNSGSFLTVKGSTVIQENQSNGLEQNVMLNNSLTEGHNGGKIVMDGLTAEADVGITARYATGSVAGTDASVAVGTLNSGEMRLTSDNDLRSITTEDNTTYYLTRPQVVDLAGTAYYTMNDARNAANGTTNIMKLMVDVPENDVTNNLSMTGDIILDLNGHTLGKQVTGAGKLTLIDTTTNDYDCTDGYGKLLGGVAETVELQSGYRTAEKRNYIVVTEADGAVSAHRVYMGVRSKALRPTNAGIGWTVMFKADSVAKAAIAEYGICYQVKNGDEVLVESYCQEINKPFTDGKEWIVVVSDILVEGDAALSETQANYEITGTPYVKLASGDIVLGGNVPVVFKTMFNQINSAFTTFTSTQQAAVQEMFTKFQTVFESNAGWEYTNIAQ